ncbi:hypothetical protein ACA910_003269 [Epithemia clementina (nom. ined.)]
MKNSPQRQRQRQPQCQAEDDKDSSRTTTTVGGSCSRSEAWSTITVEAKNRKQSKRWHKYQALMLDSLDDFVPRDDIPLSQYGGRLDMDVSGGQNEGGEKGEHGATGFFCVVKQQPTTPPPRIEKDDNPTPTHNNRHRWTLIDPEGHPFLSVGVNSVSPLQLDDEAFRQNFDSAADWARKTNQFVFQHVQCNTLGCWSNVSLFQQESAQISLPYCRQWNFLRLYCRRRHRHRQRGLDRVTFSQGPLPVFDPEFEIFCDQLASSLTLQGGGMADTRNDPWLLGHFSDNEVPLRSNDILHSYLSLPESDPGHQAAWQWLVEHHKSTKGETITPKDDSAFCCCMIDRYYQVVSTAIRNYDPNHLFLGSRLNGRVLGQGCVFSACANWVDVVSVNYYHHFTPDQDSFDAWSQQSGRPILITEFYVQGEDGRNSDNHGGAGMIVHTQDDRGLFYQNFCLGLLQNPNVVGWHWFRYIDRGHCNQGIFDANYRPYTPLALSMQAIHSQLYPLSDYFWWKSTSTNTTDDGPLLLSRTSRIDEESETVVESNK